MTAGMSDERRRQVMAVFRMPLSQTILSRTSSMTNAFVSSLIPTVRPTAEDVEEALSVLGMTWESTSCSYCGKPTTEWDHLRPLVIDRRPTGYISEIANLVPACGKCNQSKGNKPWRTWMLSTSGHAPTARGVSDVAQRMDRLTAFEAWRQPTKIDLAAIIGADALKEYWALYDALIDEMRHAQLVADQIRARIDASVRQTT
jgi:hypothetical protein